MLLADLEHIQPPGEPLLLPCKVLPPRWHTVTEPLKGHSTILSSQLLQGDGEWGKASEFHEYVPNDTFYLLWIEHLYYAVQNTTMVDKTFYKYMDSSFGKSNVCREDKFVSKLKCLFQQEQNAAPLMIGGSG